MLSGLLSALCGLEILLKTNTAKADYASTYVLQAILCAVLGATNPNGGFAKVSCLVLSLLSLQFLSSGFNMLRLGGYYKDFSWGLLLMIVLSLEYFSTIVKGRLKKNG
jgi:simple sugar transport system permease protein